jgi:hypothetical protein
VQAKGGRKNRLPVCRPERRLPIHSGAQGDEFMLNEWVMDPRERLGWCLDGSEVAQMRELQSRPTSYHRVLVQPSADRIVEHVKEDRQEMRVSLNRKTFKPALPHMPVAVIMLMVAADVTRHPPLLR